MAENSRLGHKREVQTTKHSKTGLKTKLFLKVREQIKLEISHRGDHLKGERPAAWLSSAISLSITAFDVCHIGLEAKASSEDLWMQFQTEPPCGVAAGTDREID